MKKMRTRLLSLLLVLVTVLSLLPTSALAASGSGTGIKPADNTDYWTTRLLHDGTPYSYKPPMAAGKLLYCLYRGYGYRWGTASFLNSYTYTSATGADADTVLKRFTYMGDIQAQAYGIYADGQLLAVVESEKIAEEVLDKVLDNYLKNDDNVEYEYAGFAEEIEIEPYNTSLANVTSKNAAYNKIKSGGQQEVTYEVVAGDTLSGICEKLDVSLKELQSMNDGLDENDTLHVGDKFVISQEVPLLTVETVEVSTYAEKIKYETEYKESSSYYEGEEYVTRAGKNGMITDLFSAENS